MPKKAKIIFAALFFVLAIASCRRDNFDTQLPFVAAAEIPAGLGTTLTYNFPIDNVAGTSIDMAAARPNQIQLYLEQGEGNFDFVRQAFLYIETDSSLTEVGYMLDQPMNNRTVMVLLPDLVDIQDLIKQPNFRMLLKLNLRYPTLVTSRLRIELGVGINYAE